MFIRELRGVTPTPITTAGDTIEIDAASYGISTGIEIARVTVQQTTGTGNFVFSIGNKENFVTGSISERYLSGSTAYNITLDESDIACFTTTSGDGKLYFRFTPDAGSNNIYTYSVMYRR